MIVNPQNPPHEPISVPCTANDTRWLLAWLTDSEATPLILGHPPLPTDDLAEVKQRIDAARAARAARQPWQPGNPVVNGDPKILRKLRGRQDLQTVFAGTVWRPAWVDLRRILALQKHVTTAGQLERVAKSSLIDLCFPTSVTQELRFSKDGDGKGMTLSTPDMNLRVAGAIFAPQVTVGPGVTKPAIQILLEIPISMMTVGCLRGRYFLRDGYHRAGGLLRTGKPIVPCIVIDAPTIQELIPTAGLFSEDVLFDERPPALTDFWDDTLAYHGHRPGNRYVRVRGDEIVH